MTPAIKCIVYVLILHHSNGASMDDYDELPEIIDLTWRLRPNETMAFPTLGMKFKIVNMAKGYSADAGGWTEANGISGVVHTGTHMDAPCHFCETCWKMEDIPFEKFFGPAIVIDVKEKTDSNRDYELTLDDIRDWEEKYGEIPEQAMILMYTGGGQYWGDPEKFWGTTTADVSKFSFPGISFEAVDHMVNVLNVKAFGVDWGSVDSPRSIRHTDLAMRWYAHKTFLGNNRLLLEFIGHLDKLPPKGYDLHLNPMKLENTCGSQMRLLAFKTPHTSGACDKRASHFQVLLIIALLSLFCLKQF